ncbi:MAG TPA: hypothetical protein VHR66_27840 [Gemmataceae bacterium]|nr:hypothetical protein [Gemmataceae bacterium]
MNSAHLTHWLDQRPFEPFRIVMTDGGVLDIFHPDQIILFKTTAHVGRRATAQFIAERDITIALLHVIRLEPLD